MSKNTRTRILLTAVAALLLVTMAVGGTLAWLVDSTEEVTNTFTTSEVDIDLTETKPENQKAQMIPGSEIEKNPTVVVEAGSEACWLFVKVTPGADVKDYLDYAIADGWTELTGVDGVTGVYYRSVDADTAKAGVSYPVLKDNKVKVLDSVTNTMMDKVDDGTAKVELTFTAYACQSANVTDVKTAWTNASSAEVYGLGK